MKNKRQLRCPKCKWLFEVEKPDNLHPHGSTTRPNESDVDRNVIEEIYDCRNSDCLNPTVVYWHMPKAGIDFL